MRADAVRNVHRIVEVAARLLGEEPHAGMAEVATAAGVSRATVYRHFPSREVLLSSIRQQALEHGEAALTACRLDTGSATDALRRLVRVWLELAERYSFAQLAAQPGVNATPEAREYQRRAFGEPLSALIARGQAEGEFAPGMPPEWAARVFGAVVLAGARSISDGSLSRADAPDVVADTLLSGLQA